MYDIDASDSDYSYYDSDVEYNTLDPYDYDLNHLRSDLNVEESPEDKLLQFINNDDLEGVRRLLPDLLIVENDARMSNGANIVNGNGDNESDISNDDRIDEIDEIIDEVEETSAINYKEVLLKGGETPLMVAVALARTNIVEYLISMGVNINYCVANSNKCALLCLASNVCVGWRNMNDTWRLEAPKCLRLLIEGGVNVKVRGYYSVEEGGYTALHYAALSNYWEMLSMLIHAGADVDAMSNQKETALMLAATRGYVACCNTLLLAGAKANLTDRSGNNASYLAGVEGHKMLSDAISVYCGSAQHNVDLYKIWSQYVQKESDSDYIKHDSVDIVDNISNTCIESFCLALDAPYLVAIMEDEGVTISDLKMMSEQKLKEIGVSEDDCSKIMTAMQDFNRKTCKTSSKISFEYGKPLKMVNILEMIGNMSEHIELIDTNLECWYTHLSKKYQTETVLHRATIKKLQRTSLSCIAQTKSFIEQLAQLKAVCGDQKENNNCLEKIEKVEEIKPTKRNFFWNFTGFAVTVVTISVGIAFISRRLK